MSYTHKVIEFYGDPINFFINKESVDIGCRSLIKGMRIDWSSQCSKIKLNPTLFKHKSTALNPVTKRSTLLVNRHAIIPFLDSIDIRKVKEESKDKVTLYKKEFPQFSYDQTTFGNQVEIEDFYLGSIEGIKQLIYDAVIKLGNEKAIEQLALILFPLLTEPIISNDHIEILGPAYDLAEKTADRQNELIKHKSTSISKQLEIVAETIRDSDRKSSLELRRIAKSVY